MKNPVNAVKDYIAHYLKLRITSIRLEIMECISKAMGYITLIIIVAFFFFLSLLYFSLGLFVWLRMLFGSPYQAMFCTGGILLLIAFIFLLFMRPFVRLIAGKVAAIIWSQRQKRHHKDDLS